MNGMIRGSMQVLIVRGEGEGNWSGREGVGGAGSMGEEEGKEAGSGASNQERTMLSLCLLIYISTDSKKRLAVSMKEDRNSAETGRSE